MEIVFSVGSAPRPYNEDPRPAEKNESSEMADEWLRKDDKRESRVQLSGKELGCGKKTSCVLQLLWDWYNYVLEFRCQDMTSEDWEP
jgi:hypothetical protein